MGRDLLVALCVSLSWRMFSHGLAYFRGQEYPGGVSPEMLTSFRSTVGEALELIPGGIRGALFYFFILFALRVLLRNQWLAAGAYTLLMAGVHASGSSTKLLTFGVLLFIFSTVAFVVLRFGLLALTLTHFADGLLADLPVTFDPTAFYFPGFALLIGIVLLMGIWGFKQAIAGRQLWRQELFG